MKKEIYLNRDSAQKMLDTRPTGTTAEQALAELAKQGFKIEGYNDTAPIVPVIKAAGSLVGGFVKSALAAPGKVGETALQAFDTSVAKPAGEYLADKIKGTSLEEPLKATKPFVDALTEPQFETAKSGADLLGAGLQTAAYLIPYGKVAQGVAGVTGSNLLGQIGAGLTGGYTSDVGGNLQDPNIKGADNLKPGLGTAIGVGVPLAFAGAKVVGRAAQKMGSNLAGDVLPVGTQEAGIIQSYKADKTFGQRIVDVLGGTEKAPVTTGTTVTRQGLFGGKKNIGIQAKRAQDKLWNDFLQPQLDNATVRVNLPKYFDTIEQKIIADTPEMTRQKALLEALDSFRADYAGVDQVSLAKLQKLKEGWAEFVPEKFYKGQNIAGNAKQVSALLADEARQTIYSVLGPEARQAYFDYGNLKGLAELGKSAMTNQKLKGGSGSFISEILSKGVTPVGTVAGNVIYKVGEGLEFIGNAGAKTLDAALGLKNQDLNIPAITQASQTTAKIKNKVNNIPKSIPQSTEKASGKVIPKELQPLAEEARKYKSAEEFVRAMGANEYSERNVVRKYLGTYSNSYFDFPKLSEHSVGKKLPETITVYRGVNATNPVDAKIGLHWTTDKEYAKQYGKNIQTITAPKSDFRVNTLVPSSKDFVYLPKGTPKSKVVLDNEIPTLTDIWNKANTKVSPLAEEAKKYKSAEDFIKGQGNEFYHGTTKGNSFSKFDMSKADTGVGTNINDQGNQIYLTTSKDAAKWFSKMAESKNQLSKGTMDFSKPEPYGDVLDFLIDKKAKVLKVAKMPRGEEEAAKLIGKIKSQGYDAVEFPDEGFNTIEGQMDVANLYKNGKPPSSVIVLNEKVLKSKQQLIDLWNKANGKK